MATHEKNLKGDCTSFPTIERHSLRWRLSITSLAAMVATAILLITLYRQDQLAEHSQLAALENEKSLAHLMAVLDKQINTYVSHYHDPGAQVPQAIPDLDSLFASALKDIHEDDALKLKIYNLAGIAIYSSAKNEIGGASKHPDFVGRALRGETVHSVEHRDTFYGMKGEIHHEIDVALTYMPLLHAGKQVGVIEIYDDATPVFKRLHDNIIQIILIVFGAFAALYAVLFYAARNADLAIANSQKALSESEERWKFALEGAGDGVWDWNPQTDEAFFSKRWKAMLGYAGHEFPGTGVAWAEHLHPEDKDRVLSAVRDYFAGAQPDYTVEFRMCCKDGSWKWILARGKLISRDAEGKPLRMIGTHTDISGRKQTEVALVESRNLLQNIIDATPVRIFWKDKELRYLGCNPVFAKDAGEASPQDVIGKNDYQLAWKEQAELYRADDQQVMDSGIPKLAYEEPQTTPEGNTTWLRTSKVPLRNSNNETIGVLGIYQDITEQKRHQAEISAMLRRYRTLMLTAMDGIHIMDVHGNIVEANDAFCRMLGYTREEVIGLNVADWDAQYSPQELRDALKSIAGKYSLFETLHRRKDGALIHVEVSANGMEMESLGLLFATSRDITERKKAEEQLRIAAATFETHEAILITDADANIIRVNRAFTEITGYSQEEVLGKNPRILSSGRQDKNFYTAMWQQLEQSGKWAGEIVDKRKNGEVYPKWLTITAVKNEIDEAIHYVGIFKDITERKKAEEAIHQLAFYDTLTKLPNRRLFLDRFGASLTASARHNNYGALLFIDLDRFKMINDTLGHEYGDLLLVEVATRIRASVREMDTVARLGGDEFVVLIEDVSNDQSEAACKTGLVAEKIRESLAHPYNLNGHEHHCSPSIGVSLYRGNEETVEELLRHADIAMYQAKDSGRNAVRLFDPAMQSDMATWTELVNDLRSAISRQQLQLYYQLQVDKDNRPAGAEALLRWIHPQRGMVMPEQFLPAAEESSLILDIDDWVLEAACRQLALWNANEKMSGLALAVNISTKQFAMPDFAEKVANVLRAHQINPARLKLELTESMALDDLPGAVAKMHALKALGVSLSMDDFGSRYSSLSSLKHLPLDQIKLGRSFVRDITTDGNVALLVQSIIDLSSKYRISVIAEGVENEAQLASLKDRDCVTYQGFLFSKAITAEEFEQLLNRT